MTRLSSFKSIATLHLTFENQQRKKHGNYSTVNSYVNPHGEISYRNR